MNTKKILAVLSFFLVVIFLTGCNQESQVITPDDSSLQKTELTAVEIEGLTYMRLAEKLAHDVYTELALVSDYKFFDNFSKIEQMHMDKVLRLIEKYDEITDPLDYPDVAGEFPDDYSDFQVLYDDYINLTDGSYEDPLDVGIAIEKSIVDYLDAQLANEDVNKADIIIVYTCLLESAQNHLAAFDPTYTP